MEYRTKTPSELRHVAEQFAVQLAPRSDGATVVALSGELGAGKTAFVQALAAHFGVADRVLSPTFVIEKVSELEGTPFRRLIHIDAYRLEGQNELEMLGWRDLIAARDTLICIEWPERVPGLLPEGSIRIHFDFEGEGRIISINGEENSRQG